MAKKQKKSKFRKKLERKFRKFKKKTKENLQHYYYLTKFKLDNFRKKVKTDWYKLKESIYGFIENHNQNIKEIRNFIIFSAFYGAVINYMLWGLFDVNFTLARFPAFGVAFYFLTEEFIKFIHRVRHRNQ